MSASGVQGECEASARKARGEREESAKRARGASGVLGECGEHRERGTRWG